MAGTNDAKRELRRAMRIVRAAVSSEERLHRAIDARLTALLDGVDVGTVMVFRAVPGEPHLRGFERWCRARGIALVVPDADPAAAFPATPGQIDAVVVPGLAFTRSGRRLGQGGGWYDRFLAAVRPDCVSIGVCFDEQVIDELPTEPHDVAVRWVVTPTRTIPATGEGTRSEL